MIKPPVDPNSGFWRHVQADLWRCQGAVSGVLFFKTWFQDPAFRPVFTLRLAQALHTSSQRWARPFGVIAKLWHRRTQFRCGVDVPWSLSVGEGFKLAHGWGVVINRDARIGRNVTVMQGVTIGGNQRGVPTLADDVMVCANATIIGAVTLGRGAVVGAGCVVTRDVAPHTTVVGNPQRVIARRRAPAGYNPLPFDGAPTGSANGHGGPAP